MNTTAAAFVLLCNAWATTALAPPRHQSHGQHRIQPSDWFVVNQGQLSSLEDVPIYGICFSGTPPRPLETADLELPHDHRLREAGAVFVVHTLINAQGLVVKAQILKPPAARDLLSAIARCLSLWRFEPAVDSTGKPAAVHFNLTFTVGK